MATNGHQADRVTPIAVVGLSFRGPGDATSPENLLRMISSGRESRSKIPAQKWNHNGFYHPDANRYGTHNVEYGHWMAQDPYAFDAPFFNLSSAEAAALDPQQRMLLECSYEAFENSGTPLTRIVGTSTSVFAASFAADYTDMLWRDPESVPMYQCTNSGFSRANLANRVSYSFDLRGPSIMVDTACSGGLTALHLACQSLWTGEVRQAVAAGSSLILGPEVMVTMSMMRFLSPDGRCYAFDERANGYARGEGVAVLLLKRLDDAIADGDTIRTIIRGTGANQDGKTPGITMPNSVAQEALIRSVYERTGLDPLETSYVECHGTGTQAGDTAETGAISRVFNVGRQDLLTIGSVKTNVGHLEGASGLAGVIKCILMLENGVILPNRNFEKPNPKIPLKDWHLQVPTMIQPWRCSKTRRASVNSFGYGGANVHAILESAEDFLRLRGVDPRGFTRKSALTIEEIQKALAIEPVRGDHQSTGNVIYGPKGPYFTNGHSITNSRLLNDRDVVTNGQFLGNGNMESSPGGLTSTSQLFILSAFDPAAGEAWKKQLSDYVSQRTKVGDKQFLESLAFTLSERRTIHPWRAAVTATSCAELISQLNKTKFVNIPSKQRLGYVFTGQGAQWCGMGKELINAIPSFRESLERCGAALQRNGASFHIIDELERDFESSRVNEAIYSQPLCTALQIALVDMLTFWGVHPRSVTGHSSGEIAAAYAAGALSLEDAMLIAYERGHATSDLANKGLKGAMTAVAMERDDLVPILTGLKNGKAVIACSNSPSSFTVSGDKSALDELQQVLREKGTYNRRLVVEVAYHSHHMETIADSYRNAIRNVKVLEGNHDIDFFSSVSGKMADKSRLGTEYWVNNLLNEVKFAQSLRGLVNHTDSDGEARVQTLVEIGPHAALAGPVNQILDAIDSPAASSVDYLSVLVRKKNAMTTALALASSLFISGHAIKLSAVNQNGRTKVPPLIDLPPYAWNHAKSYTAESRISKVYRNRKYPRRDLIGVFDVHSSVLEPRWRQIVRLSEIPWVQDHKIQSSIVYPAAGYLAMAMEAAAQRTLMRTAGSVIEGYRFRDVVISSGLVIPEAPGEVEVVISVKAYSESVRTPSSLWDEFCVSSVSKDDRWTEHCRGLISVQSPSKSMNLVNGEAQEASSLAAHQALVEEFEDVCQTPWKAEELYERLSKIGMHYGPTFANLESLRWAPGHCIGIMKIPDTAASMPMHYEQADAVHPGTLDSIFQTYLPALATDSGRTYDAIIPVSIEDMFIAHGMTQQPGDTLVSYTSTSHKDYRFSSASMTVFEGRYTPGSKPVVQIGEMTLASLDRGESSKSNDEALPRAYNVKWAPDVDLLAPEELADICSTPTVAMGTSGTNQKIDRAVAQMLGGVLANIPEQRSMEAGQYAHNLWKLISAQVELHTTHQDDSGYCSPGECSTTIARAVSTLPKLLVGEATPADFTQSCGLAALAATPGLFENNRSVAAYIRLLAHKNPSLTVLTIGPQSGPASLHLLSLLSEMGGGIAPFATFHHSDAELNAQETAKTRFPSWADLIDFQHVIEEGGTPRISSTGVENKYDIVIAFNAIHSSRGLPKILSATSTLLTYGGKLVLVEHAPTSPLATLLWGPLPSFISSQADITSPMSMATAQSVIHGEGYKTHATLSNDVLVLQRATEEPEVESGKIVDVLIVAEQDTAGIDLARLQSLCEDMGAATQVVSFGEAHVRPGQACVVLSELSRSVLVNPEKAEWEALKQILHNSAGLIWVTRGAGSDTCANPQAALIQGLARTVRAEVGDGPVVTLDLESVEGATAARCIANVLRRRVLQTSVDGDVDLVERSGVLHVPRMMEDLDATKHVAEREGAAKQEPTPTLVDKVGAARLFAGTPGLLDTLHFAPDERVQDPLPADYVEMRVKAAGINFKDVMMAMGQIPVEDLGCESSGTITAVGSAVQELQVGDRVVCMGSGSFCTQLRLDARLVHRVPDSLSLEKAAGLPITYVTAFHAVHNMARLGQGETILVHAATGGLGQAVVEFSQLVGAVVLVTVGSVEKKRLVQERFGIPEEHIMFSRNTSFAGDVMRLTHGRGVDVVVNSLAGEALRQSWSCIAPNGRFVELGQRDITINARLDMGVFARNASFAAYNLAYALREDPQAARDILGKVLALYAGGALRGPHPLETVPFSQLGQTFRKMQTGVHVGKLVAVVEPGDTINYQARQPVHGYMKFRPDATYLLVGGLGGLGRATALWMASRGARHMLLLSRSGRDGEGDASLVGALEAVGCRATVAACDVADAARLGSVLTTARDTMPPLRGVIQGAMVLRDGLLANMALDDWLQVLRPKVQGTWNLHRCLPADLDFFVLESSVSGIVGNASQAAYAAANTFLDAFARYRRSHRLPATTVDIGAVDGLGYLAQNQDLKQAMERQGFDFTNADRLMRLLDFALTHPTRDPCHSHIVTGLGPWHADSALPALRAPLFSRHRLVSARASSTTTTTTTTSSSSSSDTLRNAIRQATSLPSAVAAILTALVNYIVDRTDIPLENVSTARGLHDYGIDSLVAVELRNWIAKDMEAVVPILELLGAESLTALAAKIAARSRLITLASAEA